MSKEGKPIFKQWWFWVGIIVVLGMLGGLMELFNTETEYSEVDPTEGKMVEEVTAPGQENAPSEKQLIEANQGSEPLEEEEISLPELIEEEALAIIETLNNTSIKEIRINENMSNDDPDDYIVLVYLSFDAKNKAGTAKQMIEMYNNEIGTKLADVEGANEVTVFWEVPYLKDGDNIAKANLVKREGNMYFEEHWFDGNIFP